MEEKTGLLFPHRQEQGYHHRQQQEKILSPNNSKENTLIEISSDLNPTPAGLKHKHKDDKISKAASSKKHKGKGKEVETFDFHPPQPQPKKINAKITRVSVFYSHFVGSFAEMNI